MSTHGRHPILTSSLATTLATLALCGAAHATDGTWTQLSNGNASGNWGDPTNWLDGQIADGIDAIADFSTLDLTTISGIYLNPETWTVGTLAFGDAVTNSSDWLLASSSFGNGQIRLDVSSGSAEIIVLNRTLTIDAPILGDDGIRISNGSGPGGTVYLKKPNSFTGGITISGTVLSFANASALGSNTITVEGSTGESRVEFPSSIFPPLPLTNDFVIEDGVTAGTGHAVIEVARSTILTGSITIHGSTANGGHLRGATSGSLELRGALTSSVPVVQTGGTVRYFGAGNFPELRVSGTAVAFDPSFFPPAATLTVAGDQMGDGLVAGFLYEVAEINLGRVNSSDRATIEATIGLTGDLTAQGDATHLIGIGSLSLGTNHSTFTVADGSHDVDLIISSAITGRAGFTKAGAGTLLITEPVTNSGPLMIEGGTLMGQTANSGPLSINSGVTLVPGTELTPGSMTAASISFAPGASTVKLNVGSGGDVIEALDSNGLRADGTTTIDISTFGGPLTIGTHDLIAYAGTMQGAGLGGFILSPLPGRAIGSLVDTGSAVALNVTSNDTTTWTGATNGTWDADVTPNWKLESTGTTTAYLGGDDVRFDDSASVTTITLDESVSPSRVVFANSTSIPYVLGGSGGIEGPAVVHKTGSGTATLRTHNGYTGATTVSEGTLAVDYDAGSLIGPGLVDISAGATLALTSSNTDFIFDRALSGAGTVVIDANAAGTPGNRTVTLSGTSSDFTGVVELAPTPGGGTLRIQSSVTPLNLGTAIIRVKSGAQIQFGSGEFANPFEISGIGYLEPSGGTPHPGSGLGTEGGRGAINGSTSTILTGPIVLDGNTKLGSTVLAGDVTAMHPNDQLVAGGGSSDTSVVLAGTNSYGPTWVNSGSGTSSSEHILQIGNDGTTGTLGNGLVTLLGETNAKAILRFSRLNGFELGNDIVAIGNAANTFVDADVRGAGFSTNGHTIDLGPADSTGGTFRVGRTRSDSRAIISDVLNAGKIEVAANFDVTGAGMGVQAGSTISVRDIDVGRSTGGTGSVTHLGGDVSVAGSIRIGGVGNGTGRYELAGGALTFTAPVGSSAPNSGSAGGIFANSSSEFLQSGGILTTNWIFYNYAFTGGLLVLKSDFGLIGGVDSTEFRLEGGTIQAAPGVSPAFDAKTISISGLVTLEAEGADGFNVYGPLGGTGEVALVGSGTLRLLDASGGGGSLRAVSLNVGTNTTVRADRTDIEMWSGVLRGGGSLVKENTGGLFITGKTDGFSGSTEVSAGRLELPGDFSSPSITVSDGAALGGEPTVPSLTLGSISGSSLFFDGSTASALTVGSLTLNGPTTVNFSTPPNTAAPTTVLNYGAKSGIGDFLLPDATNYRSALITDTGSSITIDVATKNLRWTGAFGGFWDLNSTGSFSDGANPEKFYAGDSVTFDDTGASPDVRILGTGINPWRVTVDSDIVSYSFTGERIGGPATLIKAGASTLTLNTPNSYSGPTIINGGTIAIINTNALGDGNPNNGLVLDGGHLFAGTSLDLGFTRNVTVGAAGGELSAYRLNVLTISGSLNGNGNLRVADNGIIELKGNGSEFTGDVSVDSVGALEYATVLRLSNDQALTGGTVTLFPGTVPKWKTTLELNASNIRDTVTLKLIAGTRLSSSAGVSTWNGPIFVAGSGIAEFDGYPGTLYVRGPVSADATDFDGVLDLSGEGILSGRVTLPNTPLEINGSWTIASSGNEWSETRINGSGRLRLGANEALPFLTRIVGEKTEGNGSFDLNGFSQTIGDLETDSIYIWNTAPTLSTLTVQNEGTTTYSVGIFGNLRLVKAGSGTLILSGLNSYSGGVSVDSGTLKLVNTVGDVFGSNGTTVTVVDGATLDVNGKRFNTTAGVSEATISGSGLDGFGAIQNTGDPVMGVSFWTLLTLAGDTTIGTNSRFDISSGAVNGGTFTLTKKGTGETWWSPAAGATIGNIVVNGGSFVVNSSDNLGSAAHRIIVGAAGTLSVSGDRTNTKPIALNGGLLTALDGTNAWNGALTLDGSGTSNRIGASVGARVNLGGSISGNGGFEKVEAGIVELQGDSNGWTGEIEVSAGTLLVSGNVACSTVVVNGGALGGNGGTLGVINVNSGTLAPGASIGTLNSGDVNFSSGAAFQLEIDSTAGTTDLLVSTGVVSLSLATLTIDDLGTAMLAGGERFTFITANEVTGTFDGLPDGAFLAVGDSQFTIDYTPTEVALVAVVPEPGVLASLLGGCGVLMGLRRFRRR